MIAENPALGAELQFRHLRRIHDFFQSAEGNFDYQLGWNILTDYASLASFANELSKLTLDQLPAAAFHMSEHFRLPPALHRRVYVSALLGGKSLNQWIAERLDRAC